MPIYTFENTKTGKVYDDMMSISEKEEFLEKNKHIKQKLTTINISSGVQGVNMKTDGGWKDNLSRIADAHPNSPLAQQHKKRSIKEVQNAYVQSVEQLSSNLLLIIDSLEAASLLAEEKKCSLEDMIEGNNLLLKSTKEMFDRLSITEINPIEEDFDPEFHQAISTEESDIEENKVLKVIQKGFKLPNKLLRPALVVVSKKKS